MGKVKKYLHTQHSLEEILKGEPSYRYPESHPFFGQASLWQGNPRRMKKVAQLLDCLKFHGDGGKCGCGEPRKEYEEPKPGRSWTRRLMGTKHPLLPLWAR